MSIAHFMQAAAYPSFPKSEVHTMSTDAIDEILDTNLPVVQSTVPPTTLTESEMKTFFDRLSTNFFSLSKQAKQLSDAIGAIERLTTEVRGLKSDNHRLQTEVIGLQNRCTLLERDVEVAQEMAGKMEQERNELRAQVNLQEKQVSDLTSKLTTAKGQVEHWTGQAHHFQKATADQKAEIEKVTAELAEAKRKAEAYVEQNQRQHDTIKAQNEAAGQLQTAITLAHHDVDRAQKAKVEADSEVETLKVVIKELTAERDNFGKKMDAIADILKGAGPYTWVQA
jgi:chromosome segregation ATPase